MDINKLKVIYTYADGSIYEEKVKDQNSTLQPSINSLMYRSNELFFVILPLIVIVALALIIFIRINKKMNSLFNAHIVAITVEFILIWFFYQKIFFKSALFILCL